MTENNLPFQPANPPTDPAAPIAKSSGLALGIIIGIIVCLTTVSAAYFLIRTQELEKRLASTPTPTPVSALPSPATESPTDIPIPTTSSVVPTDAPVPTTAPVDTSGISWLSQPQPISPLKIFKPSSPDSEMNYQDAKFYHIANFSNGDKLIYALINGPLGSQSLLRLITSGSKISYLTNFLSDPWFADELKKNLEASISPTAQDIKGITPPEYLTNGNQSYKKSYFVATFFKDLTQPQKLFDSEFGPVYETLLSVADLKGAYTKKIHLKLKDNIVANYDLTNSLFSDNFVPKIKWSNNASSTVFFNQNIVMSCGGMGVGTPFIKSDTSYLSAKQEVGRTYDNLPVYQIMDSNTDLVKTLYKNYQTGSSGALSLSDFASKPNHFLWQDSMGDWQIFISGDYSPAVECGKPVIYLYPQKDTQVSVKVGAKITQSEPLYPQQGWQVLARPSGKLVYQSQSYPYLFWEGLGIGEYPDYRNRGVIATQDNLISTLYSQLHQLGLNDQESADFMEFWQPRLPSTPLVRLTWLNTSDMNKLAPLAVSPRPNTVIRIFLEFEGLSQPKTLQPQVLTAPARQGFTLVEWGGLLIK